MCTLFWYCILEKFESHIQYPDYKVCGIFWYCMIWGSVGCNASIVMMNNNITCFLQNIETDWLCQSMSLPAPTTSFSYQMILIITIVRCKARHIWGELVSFSSYYSLYLNSTYVEFIRLKKICCSGFGFQPILRKNSISNTTYRWYLMNMMK